MNHQRHRLRVIGGIMALASATGANAAEEGRLVSTGGVVTIEGAAGGGIVPMAVMAGLSTDPGWDWVAGASHIALGDYTLDTVGVAASFNDRVEISLARQRFGIDFELPAQRSEAIHQTIVGAKLKLAGDLIFGSVPQISAGVQWKHVEDFALAESLGADDDTGLDAYFSVSRLVLDGPFNRNWLVNGTLRATRANETGLLGFGSGTHDSYRLVGEVSTALFFNPQWALGLEYRQKPENLSGVDESDWRDVFVGWFPNAHVNVVLAYADLGSIANKPGQDGLFISVTGNF
jgi:Protein of unknown function (DUF3034)